MRCKRKSGNEVKYLGAWNGSEEERMLMALTHARLAQSVATCDIAAHAMWYRLEATAVRFGTVLIIIARALGADSPHDVAQPRCGPGQRLSPTKALRYAACFVSLHPGHQCDRSLATPRAGGADAAGAQSWRRLYHDKFGIANGSQGSPARLGAYVGAVAQHISRCVDAELRTLGDQVAPAALLAPQRCFVTSSAEFAAAAAEDGGLDSLLRLVQERVPHGLQNSLAPVLSPCPSLSSRQLSQRRS